MKNKLLKIVSSILCAVIALGGCVTVLALGGDSSTGGTNEKDEKDILSSVGVTYDGEASAKDETVFVISSADGSAKKIISSCHLKNPSGSDKIEDVSTLDGIENVKSDGAYTKTEEGIVWDAGGDDVYYRGESTKTLPVDVEVSYYLEGKKVSPEEIAGKDGSVTIRFDYKNNEYRTATIGGKEEKIYVPFAVVSGAMLDNKVFSNIEVTNGKAIDDGDRTIVVGAALPGMQENLAIAKENFEVPSFIEINATAKGFRLDMTLTLALNDVFSRIGFNKDGEFRGVKDQMNSLTDAAAKLISGASALTEGLETLNSKTGEIATGTSALSDGADKAASGAATLSDGAKTLAGGADELSLGAKALDGGVDELKAGVEALRSGLETLDANSPALRGGAKTVFETLLATATEQINASGVTVPTLTIENYSEILTGAIASLDDDAVYAAALAQVTSAVEANRDAVTAAVTAQVRENVRAQVIASATGLGVEQYEAAVTAGQIGAAVSSQIESATDAQMASDDVKAIITQNVENTISSLIAENMAGDEVQAKLSAAADGAKSLIALKTSLDSYNAFYLGLITYTDGVSSAAKGAAELDGGAGKLKDGASQLSEGAEKLASGASQLSGGAAELAAGTRTLADGTEKLASSAPALTDGVKKLYDGSKTLSDGLKRFGSEVIDRIAGLVTGLDIDGIADRVSAVMVAAKSYTSYSGAADGVRSSVKFIWRTDAVKADK